MADLRTTITEVVTGLGMLGFDDVDAALSARPEAMENVEPSVYDGLALAWKEHRHADLFTASLMNGRAFLAARDALRHRTPFVIEWKGAHKAPGDEVIPADLRVDHVYFVSCKYLSRIVVNASPHNLFDRKLAGGHGKRGADWFQTTAPEEHAALHAACVEAVGPTDRRTLAKRLRDGWPEGASELYAALVDRVAEASAAHWRAAIANDEEAMLWRLLRIGSAPYYVLGASPRGFLRLRIATPWDWRRDFELRAFDIQARPGGQAMVGWQATVRERGSGMERDIDGHVEIRWSHGRFSGPPEAKVYLDTPHTEVPGYFALA
jgi:hypothetical protein